MRIQYIELPEDTPIWHSRNYFILSFNLIGISFIDMALLKQSNIQGERIVYKRRKTGKIYNVKLTAKAKEILEIYKPNSIDEGNDYYLLEVVSRSEVDLDKFEENKERLAQQLRSSMMQAIYSIFTHELISKTAIDDYRRIASPDSLSQAMAP